MTRSEYVHCDICNRSVEKTECKRVSITAINLIIQEDVEMERTIIYVCTCCYPTLKLAFVDAVLKVLDAEGSEGYWKYLLEEEKYKC
jgi:hypothetical protein